MYHQKFYYLAKINGGEEKAIFQKMLPMVVNFSKFQMKHFFLEKMPFLDPHLLWFKRFVDVTFYCGSDEPS